MHCVENEVLIPTIFKMILQLYGYYFIPTQTFNHKYVNWRCVATFIYQLSPPHRTLDRKNYIYKLHNTTRYLMDRLKTTYPVFLCSNGSEASKQQHVVNTGDFSVAKNLREIIISNYMCDITSLAAR